MSRAVSVRRAPRYRHYKPSGQALVTLPEKDHCLGPSKSKASRAEYDRPIGEWLVAGRSLPDPETQATIAQLALT